MKVNKWKDIDGVSVMFGELAGYTVCLARNDENRVGLSFCNPIDRMNWNRDKGIDMALSRGDDDFESLQFNEKYSMEEYVTMATYFTDYVPQILSDSVRQNAKHLYSISDKKKSKILAKINKKTI